MLEQLKQMNAELEELKQQHLEKSKVLFMNISKQLFEKHPLLKSFSWSQYTPYFNDGDECTFSANTDYPYINGVYSDDPDYNNNLEGVNVISDSEEFLIEEMKSEDDVKINIELCELAGYAHLKNRKIGRYGVRRNPNYNPAHGSLVKDVKTFLSEIKDEILRDMFGDHRMITVRVEKVEVVNYNHD